MKDEKIDIHGYEKRLERAENLLKGKGNPDLISAFARHARALGLSEGRITRYILCLKKFGEWLGKDFREATKEDIERLVARLESSDYSPWSKHTFKAMIKRFYKWLKGNDEEYPPEVRWIKVTLKQNERRLPSDILTEDEIRRLVEAADHPRDRAFIMTLYETGGRVGEVGSLRIKDLEFNREYASVQLKGKTGSRRLPIVASVPYLTAWLDHHPLAKDPEAPLWIKLGKAGPLSYPALAKILKKAAKKSGLKKKVTPHKLRHSRATFLASKLTEAQMNAFFGWKQGSDMPSTYVHLSGRDMDSAILGIYGLKKEPEAEKTKLLPKNCPRCKHPNPPTSLFCALCGFALDMKTVVEMEEKRTEIHEIMNVLFDDPRFRGYVKRKLREMRRGKRPATRRKE